MTSLPPRDSLPGQERKGPQVPYPHQDPKASADNASSWTVRALPEKSKVQSFMPSPTSGRPKGRYEAYLGNVSICVPRITVAGRGPSHSRVEKLSAPQNLGEKQLAEGMGYQTR